MSKTFGSGAEVKAYVLKQMQPAVKEVQEKVHDVCTKFLNVFYGEYEPSIAIRTYQVFNSLTKTEVKKRGNGWEAEVYFDLSKLNHPKQYIGQDGRTVTMGWNENQVMHSVMIGHAHGSKPGGTAVYTEALEQISPQAVQWLKQELIAAGIPVH